MKHASLPTIKQSLLFLIAGAVFSVIFYNTKDLFLGAPLSVHTVFDGATITDSFLPISGYARHAVQVEINGRVVPVDIQGTFTDGVVLSPGYNIIEITQKDRFGKEKRKVVHVVADPHPSVATAMSVHYQ